VWGKIVMEVQKENYVPLRAIYYDEDAKEQRTLYYSEIKVIGSRYLPTVMTLIPSQKEKNKTVVTMDEVDFESRIDDAMFTKNALIRFSR
jgi:outer membrane lipoprotein-sorting protein